MAALHLGIVRYKRWAWKIFLHSIKAIDRAAEAGYNISGFGIRLDEG